MQKLLFFIMIAYLSCLSTNASAFNGVVTANSYGSDGEADYDTLDRQVYLDDTLIFIAWVETVDGIAHAEGWLNNNLIVSVQLGSYPSNSVTGYDADYGDAGSQGQTVQVYLSVWADCYEGGGHYATAVAGASY